ncbi:MAG: transposase [Rhodobacteraceae bacterium]|nr:transposase [Paracoccaceae bacterium]
MHKQGSFGPPQHKTDRSFGDPLLVVCDGAPGIIKAVEPRSERQRCLFHRISNLAAKVSRAEARPEFREQARAAYQAPSRTIARDLGADRVRQWESEFPSAVSCFQDDFEARIAHLPMPVRHRKAIRTTNLLERPFGEERRHMKVIPNV